MAKMIEPKYLTAMVPDKLYEQVVALSGRLGMDVSKFTRLALQSQIEFLVETETGQAIVRRLESAHAELQHGLADAIGGDGSRGSNGS